MLPEQQGVLDLEALRRHRKEIFRLAAKYGASNVLVFGSIARGEARPDSDVDLLAEFERGRSLLDLVGFQLDVQEMLGRHVDVGTVKALKDYNREEILREAVPL